MDITPVVDLRQSDEKYKNQFLFYGRRSYQYYQIFKLDLKRDFSAVAVPARPKFPLKRCSHQHGRVSSPLSGAGSATTNAASLPSRRRRRSWNWASSMTGRCNRHLRMRYTARQMRSRMYRRGRPFPKPFFEIHCTARKGGFPEEFAMAALGSKLYLFGGYSWKGASCVRSGMVLPRDVHYIDATADSGKMVKMSSQMNSGKRSPLAWTIGGKIYVLPNIFVLGEGAGDLECFDPESGSWTILQSPPFVKDASQFTIPSDGFGWHPPLLLVKNNIVLGSNLVISTHERKHYRFDTAQPSHGWTSVSLSFGSSELKFLPFDPLSSVPVGDSLIYSYVDSRSFPPPDFLCVDTFCHGGRHGFGEPHIDRGGHAEKSFLKRRLNIGDGDSYVSRFKYDAHAHDERLLHLSIKPVRGIAGMIKWGKYVNYNYPKSEVVGIGDGLVMFVKTGIDRLYTQKRSSLNIFRIQEEDEQYVASIISTALFIPGVTSDEAPEHFCSFVMKDGIFT